MRTQDDDDDPQKEVQAIQAIRCNETVNLAKDVKREATVNKPVQTKPTTKKQMRTKTAQSTGNRLSTLKQKMRQQKKKTMEPRANSNRPRKVSKFFGLE
jgi:hypothetical protein